MLFRVCLETPQNLVILDHLLSGRLESLTLVLASNPPGSVRALLMLPLHLNFATKDLHVRDVPIAIMGPGQPLLSLAFQAVKPFVPTRRPSTQEYDPGVQGLDTDLRLLPALPVPLSVRTTYILTDLS